MEVKDGVISLLVNAEDAGGGTDEELLELIGELLVVSIERIDLVRRLRRGLHADFYDLGYVFSETSPFLFDTLWNFNQYDSLFSHNTDGSFVLDLY